MKTRIYQICLFFLLVFPLAGISQTWKEVGGLNGLAADASIRALCQSGGNIFAAGEFSNANAKRYVAEWNGTAWSEVGGLNALAANDFISSVSTDAGGNVFAGGGFKNSSFNNYLAEFTTGSGIAPVSSANRLDVFPDPAEGNFTVTMSEVVIDGFVEIDNILGASIYREPLHNSVKKEIHPGNISPGTYFVKVTDGDRTTVRKIEIK